MERMSNVGSRDRCAVCGKAVMSVLCSQCENVAYCGLEHQRSHWPEHKSLCSPYSIERTDTLGRYLVATRDIKPGEVILKEKPLVVGPRVDSFPICLACYRPLPIYQESRCSRCLVAPVCGVHCERQGAHSEPECILLREAVKEYPTLLSDQSQIVLPLRCLLKLRNSPTDSKWTSFLELESHEEKRRNTLIWRDHQLNIVEVLRDHGLLAPTEDADLVQRICGILDVNSFEVRGPPSKAGVTERLRGVYLRAALMAHDCVANTHLAVDDDFQMIVHASIPIPRGHPIYFNYTSAMQGTWDRQTHLREGKYFDCTCKRCSDPTELETHMSSIWCVRCHEGFVVSTNPIGTRSPLQESKQVKTASTNTDWECKTCQHRYRFSLIATTVSLARDLFCDVDKSDTRAMEALLRKLLRTFTPQHFVILEVKQALVAAYRDMIIRQPNPTRSVLNRKTELCQDMLPVIQVIEPGISRLKGIALYELQDSIVKLAIRDMEAGNTSKDLLVRLRGAEVSLREAVTQLLYEPTHSPEGQLARIAMQDLKRLRCNIQHVEKMMTENGRDHRKSSAATSGISKKRDGAGRGAGRTKK
ncbi:SET domain-containing protein SmydA-8 isoform X3 [Cryptotermes secundus]|uniref:SET domain-containing protein SmydA-8 isoform X3 n=1 Tax=Cryptotermes secundus TaxID=105785 RepID=UPI001454BC8E|nr:SET domain-containing protein SmydA-8 isoform X3 [Cryptotermes secundus]